MYNTSALNMTYPITSMISFLLEAPGWREFNGDHARSPGFVIPANSDESFGDRDEVR